MRHVLGNGLTVLTQSVHAAPVVAVQVWVAVGSADETAAEAGLAHLHEHMLFKGTARRGPGKIAREIEAHGGEINAWTSFDQTVYHVVIAARFFEQGLDVLADAVTNAAFDEAELAREIEVVCEEIKRAQDTPARRVAREMFGQAFASHPYGKPVIGTEASVRGFRRQDVLAFYRRHYVPSAVTVVIVGDVEEGAALQAVERCFGSFAGVRGERPARPVEPPRRGPRVKLSKESVKEAHLSIAWGAPAMLDPSLPHLELAAAVLGHGSSSRLVQEVRREKRLMKEVHGYAWTPHDPGLFVVGGTTEGGKVLPAVRELLAQSYRLRTEEAGEAELSVGKRLLEADAIWQRETVQGMARRLGWMETVAGSLEFEEQFRRALHATTGEDARAAAAHHLDPDGVTLVAVVPEDAPVDEEAMRAALAEAADASRRAPRSRRAGPPSPVAFDPTGRGSAKAGARGVVARTLPSGARILVQPEASVPIVAVRSAWEGGLRTEDEAINGLHPLLARLVNKGTTHRSSREVAAEADALGAAIAGVAGRNSFGVRGDFLAAAFEPSLRLFADSMCTPAFAELEVERERALLAQEIRAREDNPSGLAFQLFSRALWEKHPYRLDLSGSEASVAALTPELLREAYRARFTADKLVFTVAGDVDPERVFGLAEELFSQLPARGQNFPSPALEASPTRPRRAGKRLDKQQAHLVVGGQGLSLRDPRKPALEVLTSVLAGQGGRLFVELRDKRSMAYSVTAFSVEGVDPGYVAVYIGCSPEKAGDAERAIAEELEKIREELVSDEELDRARRYLVGAHAIGLQKNAARAAVIALDEAYGLGWDWHDHAAAKIEAVTAEDVRRVARELLAPHGLVTAVVGPQVEEAGLG